MYFQTNYEGEITEETAQTHVKHTEIYKSECGSTRGSQLGEKKHNN